MHPIPEYSNTFDGEFGEMDSGAILKPAVFGGEAPSAEFETANLSRQRSLQLMWQGIMSEPPKFELARIAYQLSLPLAQVPEDVVIQDVKIGDIRAEWYVAARADTRRRLLFLHGGGYVVGGDLDVFRALTATIAKESGCGVLAIDYRKAPEHPYPAALQDAVAAFDYLLCQTPESDIEAERVFIGGESAGGGLTFATGYLLRDRGGRPPDALFGLGAWLILPAGDLSKQAPDPSAVVFAETYVGNADAQDPLISPIFGDPTSLPPLLLQVGEDFDTEIAYEFANKAAAAGVDVTLQQWRHMPHSWQTQVPYLPEAREAVTKIGEFLRRF